MLSPDAQYLSRHITIAYFVLALELLNRGVLEFVVEASCLLRYNSLLQYFQ